MPKHLNLTEIWFVLNLQFSHFYSSGYKIWKESFYFIFLPNLWLELISLIYLHRLENLDSILQVLHTKQIQIQRDSTQDHTGKKLLYWLDMFHCYIHQVVLSR